MSQSFTFASAGRLVCEPGASQQLAGWCEKLGISRPFLVTDGGVLSAGIMEPALAALKAAGVDVHVYADVVADPPEQVVLSAVEQARAHGTDGVIGFGGGSAMDCAKLVALLVRGEQALADIYGVDQVRGSRLPLIQLPTTAGTGSEVTPISIITTGETTKAGVVSPVLLPDIAILDATLTVGLPAPVTAATGIDAMVHAIEAYTSKLRKNPYSDMLAREALALLSANIHTAVNEGHDLAARSNMLLGAMLAGQAFANAPVAAVHALAYPLGGIFHIPHGLSNSLVLPHVLRFNLPAATAEYAQLANIIIPQAGGSDEEKAGALIDYLASLAGELGLPTRLRDAEVPESAIERLADDALLQQRLLVNNPREVTLDDARAIYREAW